MKKDNISLIVIGTTITMLLIVLIGSTFAYFTALNSQGSTSLVSIEGGKMLINYSDGTSDLLTSKDIEPSNTILVNKTFTLTGTNTTNGLKMPYKVGLKYNSTFSDGMIHYYIKRTTANENVTANYVIIPETDKTESDYLNQTIPGNNTYTGYTYGTLKNGNKYTEMVTGEFKENKENQSIEFNLIIQFPDTGLNQDSEKGATINGKVVVNYEDKNTLLDYITQLDKANNGLEVDDTPDNNLRYVGAIPKNYINFNGETWRIIGVFNNVTSIDDNGNEKKESLVKIIRDESLGNYSWDATGKNNIAGGYHGLQDWAKADLMYELNCDGSANSRYCRSDITDGYLSNKTSGTTMWYNDKKYKDKPITRKETYDYSKNIKSSEIDKIAKVRWNIRGVSPEYASALISYEQERRRPDLPYNIWDGKIALIYPSDYLYASTFEACRRNDSYNGCDSVENKAHSWLYDKTVMWTLAPYMAYRRNGVGEEYDYTDAAERYYDNYTVFWIHGDVNAGSDYHTTGDSGGVWPVIFLKSDILRTSGTGEEGSPYLIG